MKIIGVEGMQGPQLMQEIQRGGKFVLYEYCISVIILTFRRSSDIYFIRADESAVGKGIGYIILTLLLGWWGIPWGPIYSIASLATNLGGGKDVTREVLAGLQQTNP